MLVFTQSFLPGHQLPPERKHTRAGNVNNLVAVGSVHGDAIARVEEVEAVLPVFLHAAGPDANRERRVGDAKMQCALVM